jgi:hypothetical protein
LTNYLAHFCANYLAHKAGVAASHSAWRLPDSLVSTVRFDGESILQKPPCVAGAAVETILDFLDIEINMRMPIPADVIAMTHDDLLAALQA